MSVKFFLFSLLLFLPLLACAPTPEESKALVKISNVKVWRTDEQTLKVSLDYDLEMGVRLPLPYKEILIFPLEPKVKLGGTLAPFELHVGTVGVTLQIPKDAGVDWKDLDDKDTCCIVSLKGMQEEPGTKKPHYERISKEEREIKQQMNSRQIRASVFRSRDDLRRGIEIEAKTLTNKEGFYVNDR